MLMRKLTVTYKQFDVVVVPFPFTDSSATKKRPALVISDASAFNKSNNKSVMAMITTASYSPWALDATITDLASAGLKAKSIVRMKLFTLDDVLVVKKIGKLATGDRDRVKESLQQLLNFEIRGIILNLSVRTVGCCYYQLYELPQKRTEHGEG